MTNTEIPEISDDIKAKCLIRTVDDDPAMREALEFMLTAEGWRVKTYENGRSFLTDDTPSTPGCAILDVRMPGMSGLELQQEMNVRGYALPIIFLTGNGDIDMAVQALKDGASDFLPKPVKADRLIAAIEKAVKADLERRKAEDGIAAARTLWDTLTPREKEVAKGVAAGDLNKQVADRLGITEKTVQAHRSSLLRKLGLRGSAELASFLISIGER